MGLKQYLEKKKKDISTRKYEKNIARNVKKYGEGKGRKLAWRENTLKWDKKRKKIEERDLRKSMRKLQRDKKRLQLRRKQKAELRSRTLKKGIRGAAIALERRARMAAGKTRKKTTTKKIILPPMPKTIKRKKRRMKKVNYTDPRGYLGFRF